MRTIHGDAHQRAFSWYDILDQHRDVLPEYPAVGVVRAAVLPQMPYLRGLLHDEAAMMCLDAYRRAVRQRHRREVLARLTTADELREHAAARTVFTAMRTLRERGIAPLAWCMFSLDAWTKFAKGKGRRSRVSAVPSLAWVYSSKRLNERDEWFAWEEARYRGGTVVLTKPHRELLQRYLALQVLLLEHRTMPSRAEVEAARPAVEPAPPHLHNVPLQIAAERGLPALLAWAWFLVSAVAGLLRKLRSAKPRYLAAAGRPREALRELARNANARVYLGMGEKMLNLSVDRRGE